MNTINYKNAFNIDEKIQSQAENSASVDFAWQRYFLTNYQSYVTSSVSSSVKIYKSFQPHEITQQNGFILTKSIYDEYIFDLYGKNYISQFYTSSTQPHAFDYLTNVYFNPDTYQFGPNGVDSSNFDEYRLFDIVYGNYNGSGSADGNIIEYNNSTNGYDLSYPTKATYNELKQISTATEIINSEKIIINSPVDQIFALNFSSNHLYDGIAKKSFELKLCQMNGSSSINDLDRQLSIRFLGTNGETDPNLIRDAFSERTIYSFIELNNPSENLSNTLKSNFIVSGSIDSGMYLKDNSPDIYGKVYYDQGLVILDAEKLNSLLNLGLQSGSNETSSNSLRLFKSINAALNYFVIITDGNLDPGNPYFPTIENTILSYVYNQLSTPKLNIKQEINSIFYQCKIEQDEFNYSLNPSYFDENDGSLTIKKFYTGSSDFYVKPETYVTAIGLYDSFYNLIATAKISKPQRKSFDNSLIINIRLDY